MTIKEFQQLCNSTPVGTTLTFKYEDHEIKGHFVGCGSDEVVIESNGKPFIWPREVCDVRKSDYPTPSYS